MWPRKTSSRTLCIHCVLLGTLWAFVLVLAIFDIAMPCDQAIPLRATTSMFCLTILCWILLEEMESAKTVDWISKLNAMLTQIRMLDISEHLLHRVREEVLLPRFGHSIVLRVVSAASKDRS